MDWLYQKTGSFTPAANSGITSALVIYSMGNIIVINGYLNNVPFVGNDTVQFSLGTISDGFRPRRTTVIRTMVPCASFAWTPPTDIGYLVISDDGTVEVKSARNQAGTIYMNVTYFSSK